MVITEQNRINSLGAEKFNICAGAGEEKATLGAGRSQGVRIGHFCSRPYEIPKRNLCQFDLHPVWEIVWSTLVSFKSESWCAISRLFLIAGRLGNAFLVVQRYEFIVLLIELPRAEFLQLHSNHSLEVLVAVFWPGEHSCGQGSFWLCPGRGANCRKDFTNRIDRAKYCRIPQVAMMKFVLATRISVRGEHRIYKMPEVSRNHIH